MEGGPCKWGPFKPPCCQRFRNPKWVLFWLCWVATIQGMIINGLVNVIITTIEKRFAITSTETGTIASCYDIASAICLLPVTYFGGQGVKPRYIGIGVLTMALGSLLFSLPHFTTPVYEVDTTQDLLCSSSANSTCASTSSDSSLSNYKYVFFLAMLMIGAGASPFYTLGVTYLDDSLPPASSSLYTGIFYAFVVIGAAIGYLAGGEFLNIWTDFSAVDKASLSITPDNKKWVGAWWLGFVLASVLAFLVAIPISGFPKILPGSRRLQADSKQDASNKEESQDVEKANKTGHNDVKGKMKDVLKKVIKSTKHLLSNPTFMFLNVVGASEAMVVAGFSTFTPKFLEAQFGLSSSLAAQYVGFAAVPAGAGGTFLGSFLLKRFNPRLSTVLKWCVATCIVVVLMSLIFLITCESAPFAGVNRRYDNDTSAFIGGQLDNQCNAGCGCQEEDYHPVCGRDGVMYFSPCYAGCQDLYMGSDTRYVNCACIGTTVTDYQAEFTSCDSGCSYLPFFLIVFSLMMFLTFLVTIPAIAVTLRCVPDEDRSYALGIQYLALRCLGSIPGPIIFGKVIDVACLLWQKRCDGTGSCFFYDNRKLSLYLMGLAIAIKSISAIFFFLAHLSYKEPKSNQVQDSTTVLNPLKENGTMTANGNPPTDNTNPTKDGTNTMITQNGQTSKISRNDEKAKSSIVDGKTDNVITPENNTKGERTNITDETVSVKPVNETVEENVDNKVTTETARL